jgi:hypothetical protein
MCTLWLFYATCHILSTNCVMCTLWLFYATCHILSTNCVMCTLWLNFFFFCTVTWLWQVWLKVCPPVTFCRQIVSCVHFDWIFFFFCTVTWLWQVWLKVCPPVTFCRTNCVMCDCVWLTRVTRTKAWWQEPRIFVQTSAAQKSIKQSRYRFTCPTNACIFQSTWFHGIHCCEPFSCAPPTSGPAHLCHWKKGLMELEGIKSPTEIDFANLTAECLWSIFVS